METSDPSRLPRFRAQPKSKFDARGLYHPAYDETDLQELREDPPADDTEEATDSRPRYDYLKPARPPDVLNDDLTTELLMVKDTGSEQVGRGLYARKRIEAGADVFEFDGIRRGEKKGVTMALDGYSSHAIVVGNSESKAYFVYAAPNKQSPLRYLNHSCEPNIARKPGDMFGFVALRTIEPGEELTADYALLEANPYWKLDQCGCGSRNCRHTIGDVSSLPLANLLAHWQRLTPEMRLSAVEFSQDPQIAERRNAMAADYILSQKNDHFLREYSRDEIITAQHPTSIRERNRLGAQLLAPSFLKEFTAQTNQADAASKPEKFAA